MNAIPAFLKFVRAKLPRRFVTFFATSVAARAIGIVCQVVQVPLVVHALGTEAFGLWMAMTSITNLIQFADLGLGVGLQNRLTEKFTNAQLLPAREQFASVLVFLGVVGLLLGSVLTAGISHLDLPTLFHLRDTDTIAQAPIAALVLSWTFCAAFPLALAQRIAFARHEGWMCNVAQAAGSVGALLAVIFAVRNGWGLAGVVVAAQGTLLLANAVLLLVQLGQLHWFNGLFSSLRLAAVRDLVGVGAFFSVQQVVSTVMFSLPQVIISTTLGAAAVTPYNLVQRLFNLFAVLQNTFLLPLWPAYSQARARGEFDWIRMALRRSYEATVFGCIVPLVMCACLAPWIIPLWVGHGPAVPDLALIWLLCLMNSLSFLQLPCLYLLVAVAEVKFVTIYSVLGAVGGIILMLALVRMLGVHGVPLGLLCGYMPFIFIGNLSETHRYLRGHLPSPSTAPSQPG